MSPSNVVPLGDPAPADTRAIPRCHLSVDQKLAVGRWLLKVKAQLPHGHFGPWVEKQPGLSRGMALRTVHGAGTGLSDAAGRQGQSVFVRVAGRVQFGTDSLKLGLSLLAFSVPCLLFGSGGSGCYCCFVGGLSELLLEALPLGHGRLREGHGAYDQDGQSRQ